ncbi:hypothetical protein D3C78_911750 [compost metagenome]
MARAEIDLQLAVAQLHLVALLKPAIRCKGRSMGEAEHLALLGQHVEPEGILLVGPGDGYAGLLAQLVGGPHVIQMTVGQQYMGQGQPSFGDGRQQFVRLATRVDQRRLMGLVTPDEGTILGERGDRDHLELQHVGLS